MPRTNPENRRSSVTRTAFVTIGATAGFRSLLQEVASPKFLTTLKSRNFTDLIVQCGPDLDYFNTITPSDSQEAYGVTITAFSYAPDLNKFFTLASRSKDNDGSGQRDCGVIISHAGPLNLSLSCSIKK